MSCPSLVRLDPERMDDSEEEAKSTESESEEGGRTDSPGRPWGSGSDSSDSGHSPAHVSRNRTRTYLPRAAKLQRPERASLSDVPEPLFDQITLAIATAGDPLEELCKSVMNWCHSTRAANCQPPNDGMFRSLLVVFGLPSEWLHAKYKPEELYVEKFDKDSLLERDEGHVVPTKPDPFPSWWVLWLTLCRAFKDPMFWLQAFPMTNSIDLDAHASLRRRFSDDVGTYDKFEIRDVLLDPASGVRVRVHAYDVLQEELDRYPTPAGGIYRLPEKTDQNTFSARRIYDARMMNVAMHWLMEPAKKVACTFRSDEPRRGGKIVHEYDTYRLWRLADQALNRLLNHDGWKTDDGRLNDHVTFSDRIPRLYGDEAYAQYLENPKLLAKYLINTLDATIGPDPYGLTAAAETFDSVSDEPTAIEESTLMRLFDMVIAAELRGRRVWTIAYYTGSLFHHWMTVLQRLKCMHVLCGAVDRADQPQHELMLNPFSGSSMRPLDKEIVQEIARFVQACSGPDKPKPITFDAVCGELANKYCCNKSPESAHFRAALVEIRKYEDAIKEELRRSQCAAQPNAARGS